MGLSSAPGVLIINQPQPETAALAARSRVRFDARRRAFLGPAVAIAFGSSSRPLDDRARRRVFRVNINRRTIK